MRAVLRVSGREDALAAERILAARGYGVSREPGAAGVADLLVVDEWTAEDAPWVLEARARGVRVTVLAELVLDDVVGPVVAVTGTAGKTSTCRALEHLLQHCGVSVCISDTARSGNAWPDHSLARALPPGAVTVAELTSTHLCHMDHVRADVGVVTNVRPDHVELHGSIERYHAAKRRLAHAVPHGKPLVLPIDDPVTLGALGIAGPPVWGFGSGDGASLGATIDADGSVRLRSTLGAARAPWPHHGTAGRAILAAASAALALGVAPDTLADALEAVPPAAHRMVRRALPDGTTLIDNTMAATPLKVLGGLHEVAGPLVLVMGGDPAPTGTRVHASPDEQRLLRQALTEARDRADMLVAFGPAAHEICAVVAADGTAADVEAALHAALTSCPPGGTVMVAPMFPMTPAERELVAGYAPPPP